METDISPHKLTQNLMVYTKLDSAFKQNIIYISPLSNQFYFNKIKGSNTTCIVPI